MRTTHLLSAAAATVALLTTSCTHVTSSVHTDPRVGGDIWYVKTTSFLGLVFSTSVWYCPPIESTVVSCQEANMLDEHEAAPRSTEPVELPSKPLASVTVADADVATAGAAFWNAATAGAGGADVCEFASTLLSKDETCEREQCRAAMLLSSMFFGKCKDDAARTASVRSARDKWKRQAPGDTSRCAQALLRVVRGHSPQVLKNYADVCLASREPGQVEKAILDALR
jgi:hypothetical protein